MLGNKPSLRPPSQSIQIVDHAYVLWIKYALAFTFVIAVVALILGLLFPLTPTTPSPEQLINEVVDAFAKTITSKDVPGNLALFAPNATVDYRRLMVFLFPPTILQADGSSGNWGEQLDVFFGEFVTNHMTFSNCDISNVSNVQCIGYYTYTFDSNTLNLPSVMGSFSAKFELNTTTYKIIFAEALPNATSTFVWYSSSGVEPPGPVLTRKKRTLASDTIAWNVLQRQIATLIVNGQIQQAIAVCNTTQYVTLKTTFDPLGTNTSLPCNTLVHQTELTIPMVCSESGMFDQSCFPPSLVIGALTVTNLTALNLITSNNMSSVFDDEFQCGSNFSFANTCSVIQTINLIPPLSSDFTLMGGPGVQISGGMHSLLISNLGVLSIGLSAPSDEFNVTVSPVNANTGTLAFVKREQLQNLVWASPINQTGVPVFRLLDTSDLPSSIPANLITGVLAVQNGGTGSIGPFAPNQIVVSSSNGTYLTTGSLIPSFGINITNLGNGNFVFGVNTTLVNLLRFQEVKLAVPSDIFNVTIDSVTQNGTLTFVTIPQAQKTFWAGPETGGPANPSFRPIASSDLPTLDLSVLNFTGVLPVANGGTGSNTTLVGNRVILSDPTGLFYQESGLLIDGSIIIGSSSGSPQSAQLTASSGIAVINGPNTITLKATAPCTGGDKLSASCLDISDQACSLPIQSSCVPNGLSLNSVSVYGDTFLGANTSCLMPLQPSCYDISNQQCSGGPLNANCIPSNLYLGNLTVDSLTVLNFTSGNVMSQEFLNITNLIVDELTLQVGMHCPGNVTIDQNCVNLGGAVCPMGIPISESCIPNSLVFYDVTVTHNLTINEITCTGPPMSSPCIQIDGETCSTPVTDSCMQPRLKTINGVSPNGSLDFNVSGSTGISIIPLGNGILVSNTGVLSVGLSVPSAEFAITGTNPVTTTGTLTFVKSNQLAQTVWAGPLIGNPPGQPSFRPLDKDDLPLLASGQVLTGNGTNNVAVDISTLAITEIYLNVPSALLSVAGSPMISPGGNFTLALTSHAANQVFATPDGASGAPTFRPLATGDLPALLDGQIYIGNTSLSGVQAGYLSAGPGISITNGPGLIFVNNTGLLTASLSLPNSIFNITVPTISGPNGGTLTADLITQSANTFLAGPVSGSPADPAFRTISISDLSALGLTDGQLLIGSTGGAPVLANLVAGANVNITNTPGGIIVSASINGSMIGTVMSVDMTVPSALLSVTGNPITSMGTFAVTLNTQSPNLIFASPDGASGTPTFRSLENADMPLLGEGQVLIGFNGTNTPSILTGGTGVVISNTGPTTIISTNISVGLSLPGSIFSVSGSPVTSSGTLTGTLTTQVANKVFAGPVSGPDASPTFRSLVRLDLPSDFLVAGSGISIANNGMGLFTIAATNFGTVTSVGLALPSIFTVSGSPVTSTGTLTGTLASQIANTVFAAPDGASGTPTFRSLGPVDIPNLDTSKLTTGVLPVARGGTNSGTALNNNRIMVSSGGAIVEAAALTNGQLLIGSTGAAPVAATLTAGAGISVTNTAGGITIAATGTGSITHQEVSSSTTILTFGATSFTVITGMTFVLPAGTWHVTFSCSLQPSTSSVVFDIQLFSGATAVGHSVRRASGSSSVFTIHTQAIVTSDGVAATTAQWIKIGGGSATANMFSRSLFAIKVS
jgi:hypothetical protein